MMSSSDEYFSSYEEEEEQFLSTADVVAYLENEGISEVRLRASVENVKIPLKPQTGKIRVWSEEFGWRYQIDEQYLQHMLFGYPGPSPLFQNKHKYMIYNIDVLCRMFYGIKKLMSSGLLKCGKCGKRKRSLN
jgi:hypothetical protein